MTGYGGGVYGGGVYGGATSGVALLPEIPTGTLAVQIAWGADLTDLTGAGWTWADVTTDVRMADGISIALGRGDEASSAQPATLGLTLDNGAAAYSLGGQSPNWPNVRRNVPVRLLLDPGDGVGPRVAFQGYATGFTPGWDTDAGQIPVSSLSASGVLRRLGQGKDPLRSALYRYLTLSTAPTEYWPLEEMETASQGVSTAGGDPAVFAPTDSGGLLYGKVKWGGDTDNPATDRAVQVSAGGVLGLPVRPALFSANYWAVSWSQRITSGSGGFTRFTMDDPADGLNYYAVWYTDGTVEMYAVTKTSSLLLLTWTSGEPYEWDDVWHHYTMTCDQTGAAVVTKVYRDGVEVATNSATPGFRKYPALLEFTGAPNPAGTEDPITVGHVAVWSTAPGVVDLAVAAAAHVGELATDRMARLCAEQSLALAVVGTTLNTMGPQLPLAFLDLLLECETVDQGILYDGLGPGLRYICRDQRENAAVDLTIDATQLVQPFAPTDDDQRTRNRVTASGTDGAKFTFEDTTGPLGTAVIGVYDASLTVNLDTGGDLRSFATWAVHLGTFEGYRYPALALNMRSTPILAPSVLAVEPSSRVAVTNIGSVLASMPDADVELLVEGLAMTLSPYGWSVSLKCSPFGPWRVGVLAATTGDSGTDLVRLDTAGSTVPFVHSAGDLGLFVATPSGPLWTTATDDYPLDLDVGGVLVRATACSGGSSPQVFTTDPLPYAVAIGTPVAVWNPPVLGL